MTSPAPAHPPIAPARQTWRQRVSALSNVPPFVREVWRINRALTLASLALRLLRALLPVVTLYVGKLIIDEVLRLVAASLAPMDLAAALHSPLLRPLLLLVALELGLAVLADVLGRVVSLVDTLLSEQYSNAMGARVMEHAATLDLEDFEDSELQDKLDRARRQTIGRSPLLGQLFGQAQDAVTVAAFAVGLVVYAPWLMGLLLLALLPAFLGEAHFNAEGYALDYRRTPERRELDYVRQTGASTETAKEVKILRLHTFLIARFKALATHIYEQNRALSLRRAGWGALLTALGTLGYYAAYGVITWRTVRGDFSVGDLTFLAASFRRLRTLLEGLLSGFSQLAGQALYLSDLFSFFDVRAKILSPPDARPFPVPMRAGFRFEGVGFRYPGADRWAVRGLDFTLPVGQVLALVGENGAGKTTVVKLLARLYEPTEGRITLDGHDLREYDLYDLRAHIGVIFQDFVRYHLSAGENIAVGRIDAVEDHARIVRAAEQSLADEVIARLPRGYQQVIGKRFRTGVELSGGEWQKVAIARAYMREADVLILDEPTAALDARAEYEVFQRFKQLSADTTAVIISHRFSTVRMADHILVLADGRVEQEGTHEQLLAQGGRYAELFELQAAGYR
ncbi:MAG: ABC transporter ATP-binding protein [Myxococcales bacterium]|nr:ABC transporter ATP-binding protein [Myxococcales bacterium]